MSEGIGSKLGDKIELLGSILGVRVAPMLDGTAVGLSVGTALGTLEGTAVGLGVGTALGTLEGTAVGLGVGTALV